MPSSIESVVHVHHRVGPAGDPGAVPDLLIEVPHAADRRSHYDALFNELEGPFPDQLHEFFHVNTDVGAWALAEAMAEAWLVLRPKSHILLLECQIPRTFVDCNRRTDFDEGENLAEAGLTKAMPPYVTNASDQRRLTDMHAAYVQAADEAYAEVCASGGLALNPHTYGPRSLPIARIDANIVNELRRVHEPEIYAASPLRPHLDVIGRDQSGTSYCPPRMVPAVGQAVRPLGLLLEDSATYRLHPVTQGWRFSTLYPGQVFGFEVRRDLVCAWSPFAEQEIDESRVRALARAIAKGVDAAWSSDKNDSDQRVNR
ncbi:MAG: hypothetical protein AAGA48_26150 [Myxococcota bacterium]